MNYIFFELNTMRRLGIQHSWPDFNDFRKVVAVRPLIDLLIPLRGEAELPVYNFFAVFWDRKPIRNRCDRERLERHAWSHVAGVVGLIELETARPQTAVHDVAGM